MQQKQLLLKPHFAVEPELLSKTTKIPVEFQTSSTELWRAKSDITGKERGAEKRKECWYKCWYVCIVMYVQAYLLIEEDIQDLSQSDEYKWVMSHSSLSTPHWKKTPHFRSSLLLHLKKTNLPIVSPVYTQFPRRKNYWNYRQVCNLIAKQKLNYCADMSIQTCCCDPWVAVLRTFHFSSSSLRCSTMTCAHKQVSRAQRLEHVRDEKPCQAQVHHHGFKALVGWNLWSGGTTVEPLNTLVWILLSVHF